MYRGNSRSSPSSCKLLEVEVDNIRHSNLRKQPSFDITRQREGFVELYQNELVRVTNNISARSKSIYKSAKKLLVQCYENREKSYATHLRNQALELHKECLNQTRCVAENKQTLNEIAKQADEILKTNIKDSLENTVGLSAWKQGGLSSSLVVLLSDIFALIGSMDEGKDAGDGAAWKAPSAFERSTSKYWVQDDNLMDLLLTSAKLVPLLVYGHQGRLITKEECISTKTDTDTRSDDKLWSHFATEITSVYFDSPNMDMYKERIVRAEGAQLFRIRWYGKTKPLGKQPVFLELKTHHECWINTESVKERVTILEQDIMPFLRRKTMTENDAVDMIHAANPSTNQEEMKSSVQLLMTVHNLILKYDLRPCLRSCYRRVAFQSAESNDLRLTLDRNVTLIDERAAFPTHWCLPDEDSIKQSRVVRVPYSVFELKLAGSADPKEIEDLKDHNVIIDAPKFSKFLTGAAVFNRSSVNMLPYWAEDPQFSPIFNHQEAQRSLDTNHFNSTILRNSTQSMSIPSDSDQFMKNNESKDMTPRNISPRFHLWRYKIPTIRKQNILVAPKRPARVEPKSYFANERTFIQWISAALLLITISAILLEVNNGNSYKISAALALVTSAVIIVLYALFVYIRRLQLLASGSTYGYVDKFGPLLLALAVFAGAGTLLYFLYGETDVVTPESPIHVSNECFQYSLGGISKLEYQPSDVYIKESDNTLLIPTIGSITTISALEEDSQGNIETLVKLPGADLEAITIVDDDRVFAVAENEEDGSALIELKWAQNEGSTTLEQVSRWSIPSKNAEGIVYIPATNAEELGHLYIAWDNRNSASPHNRGRIDIYELPQSIDSAGQDGTNDIKSSSAMSPINRLNTNLLNVGLADSKISSLFYFENILYILHDNEQIVRAWDITSGVQLSQWRLPVVGNGFDKQWEGLAFQRRHRRHGNGLLRGSNDEDHLILYLSHDTLAQVWSVQVQETENRGEIRLPSCAAP